MTLHRIHAAPQATRVQFELDEPVLYDAATLLAASAWRETLGANLATAGALCRAYWYGRDYIRWDSAERWSWRPGCGRPMPGWGGGE